MKFPNLYSNFYSKVREQKAAAAKKIVRDPFTEAVLRVLIALTKRDALGKKKDFADALGVSSQHLSDFESRLRNFPRSKAKRDQAKAGLAAAYFVNPAYMDGSEMLMFTREPEVVLQPVGVERAVDFSSKRKKQALLDERNALLARLADLEAKLNEYLQGKHEPGSADTAGGC